MKFREIFNLILEKKEEEFVVYLDVGFKYMNTLFTGIKYVFDDKKNKGEYRLIYYRIIKKSDNLDELIPDYVKVLNEYGKQYKKARDGKLFNIKNKLIFNDKFITKKQIDKIKNQIME